ncbi:hypothetical protein QQ045_032615 [Rhodiola kirilowii]
MMFCFMILRMGSKRSYDGEEPLQLPYKYSKQFATNEKLNYFADEKLAPMASILQCDESLDTIDIAVGHTGLKVPQLVDPFEVKSIRELQTLVDKGLVDGIRLPSITDCHDDDRGLYRDFNNPFSPEYIGSSFPRRAPVFVGDPLSSFLDRYPRKQVPVGANHQAELPELVSAKSDGTSSPAPFSDQVFLSDEEEKFMGTCVIPISDSSLPAPNILPAGVGRKGCDCVDKGSVRCARQHVREAREKLMNTLGEDKFQELGLVEMGEEVAHKWSQEEEQVFHEVVFSNPASHGKDFWSCLSEEFPTKSTRDIVSYYFNVFMLRKRASQNRSQFLDIDSDDDEWHPGHGRSYDIGFVGEVDDSLFAYDENSSDEEEEDSDDDKSDAGEGTYSGDAEKGKASQLNMGFLHKESDLIPGNQDDSCVSFEFQSGINDSTRTETGMAMTEISGSKNDKYFSSDQIDLNHGCMDDSSNFRQWDQGFSAGLDHLLPTCNMMEEIFGPGSWDKKPDHD